MAGLLLAGALLLVRWGAGPEPARSTLPDEPDPPASMVHPLKLSHGRVDVEAGRVVLRVRMFWDDLEAAIRTMTEDPRFRIGHTAQADSLVGAYLGEVFHVEVDGSRRVGSVRDSGEEDDMFWYLVEYPVPAPIRRVVLRNEILVDLFPEQRNILQVRNTDRSVNRTFYFTHKREEYSVSF